MYLHLEDTGYEVNNEAKSTSKLCNISFKNV